MKETAKQLNKSEFITVMQQYSGKSKKSLEEYMDIFLEVVKQEVAKGYRINLRDFGSFEVVDRPERVGRNPKTGESAIIEARKVPKFKPGEDFKRRVNE